MNGEQSVRIVYISKPSAIDTIQTFWKRKVGAPGLGRIIYPAPRTFSVPGTVALGLSLCSLAAPVGGTRIPFNMLHFIPILLALHWIAAGGKVISLGKAKLASNSCSFRNYCRDR